MYGPTTPRKKISFSMRMSISGFPIGKTISHRRDRQNVVCRAGVFCDGMVVGLILNKMYIGGAWCVGDRNSEADGDNDKR